MAICPKCKKKFNCNAENKNNKCKCGLVFNPKVLPFTGSCYCCKCLKSEE